MISCTGANYQSMAINEPEKLIGMQDSLLARGNANQGLIQAITKAHNKLGREALYSDNLTSAKKHFQASLSLLPKDTTAKYYQFIVQGRLLMATGNKNKIWDAIEIFGKCAWIQAKKGEHHYWTGQAYQKIGDTDFDLILEAYQKAISKDLPPHLLIKTTQAIENQSARKKTLEDFWK